MNILFLTDYYLQHAGGSLVYYNNLLTRFVPQYAERVTVLTKKVPGWQEFDRRESSDALRILRSFSPLPDWKVYQYPKALLPLASAVKQLLRQRIDVVHVGDLFPQGVVGLVLKQLFGMPYIIYVHGDEIAQTDKRRFQPILRNRIYRAADGIVAANEFSRQRLLRIGIPESRICKILPGVDMDLFCPLPRDERLVRELSLDGTVVLLTAARLVPRKGHAQVLRALASIVDRVRPLRYLIAGDGPERSNLIRLAAELGLSSIVTFLGDVSNDRLRDFYNLADVFVLANQEPLDGDIETFGMVFIEANATGKPVIGVRSGGVEEAVLHGVTGMLVPPNDVDALAACLKDLLLNSELRALLGDAGLRRVREHFNWATRATELYCFTEGILHNRQADIASQEST
jgi:phosphatidylinositol alpha-1,6-mannosyltransferase